MTIDELYEAYIDKGEWGQGGKFGPKSFEEDIFDFLHLEGKGWDAEEWTKEYGKYLPAWDPSGIALGKRERDIEYDRAMDTLNLTKKATDRVYKTELDTLSTELGREMEKGRAVAGSLGLKSGSLEAAVEDTIQLANTKTKDLGDRLMISDEEMLDKYNIAMVDSALDFDKTKRQEKEDFYDRTMAMITRLGDKGALGATEDVGPGGIDKDDATMANNIEACVATLGPEPAHGSEEFFEQYGLLHGGSPYDSWWGKKADCEGVPLIIPETYDPGDWDFNIGLSDIRLKEKIEYIGHSPSGLKIYEFSYIGMNGRYQGVMSHEIPEEAVTKDSNGYDRVNYNMIDADFKRID